MFLGANMTEKIRLIAKKMSGYLPAEKEYVFLLCGSATETEYPRDIDFMVYDADGDIDGFAEEITCALVSDGIDADIRFMDELNMRAVKFRWNDSPISIHIVSYKDIEKYVGRAGTPEVYTQVDILSYTLNYPTVYRKWIIDTIFVCGNKNLKKDLSERLKDTMPVTEICDALVWNINNTISYCLEKWNNGEITKGILLLKVFREVLLYSYAINRQYFGTAKYIDGDMMGFQVGRDVCDLCIKLFGMINDHPTEQVKYILSEIRNCINSRETDQKR